jgi:hypothetical protein
MKRFRELPVAITLQPIIVAEPRADFFNRGAQRLLKL